jgi:hypothetical protein
VQGFAVFGGAGSDHAAENGNTPDIVHQALKAAVLTGDKGRVLQIVQGRVAAEGKFREDGELGSHLFGGLGLAPDDAGIAVEVANDGVCLDEGYFHDIFYCGNTVTVLSLANSDEYSHFQKETIIFDLYHHN